MLPVALLLFAGLPASLAQLDAPLAGRAASPSSYARRAFTDNANRRSQSLAKRETAGVVFSETSNATVCGSLDIKWVYATSVIAPTAVINIEITNENVPQTSPAPKPTSTSTTASSTATDSDSSSASSASISTSINSGIFPSSSTTTPFATPGPTRAAFVARQASPVSLTIATNVPIMGTTSGILRDFEWNVVTVPVGWYVITGSSPDPNSQLVFFKSAQFFVADDGNSSCLQPGTIIDDHAPTGVKPGIIAGAVVGSLLGIAAVLGLCVGCAFYRRRKSNTRSPQARPREWGQVGSHDSRPSTDSYARGPGALGRRAERHVGSVSALGHEADESLEDVEKDGHEFVLPALNRSSTTSQAYPLTAMARATPSPLPLAPSPNGQAPSRRTPRKPVPTYEARQDDEETVVGSATTHTMLRKKSSEQLAGLANVNGSTGQVHYLIPDMPLPQRD